MLDRSDATRAAPRTAAADDSRHAAWGRAALVVVACSTASILPVFLIGALAIQIGSDLGFTGGRLGLAFTAYFTGGAIASALLGRVVESVGPTVSLRLSTLGSAAALLVVGGLVHDYWHLVVLLALAGVCNAASQPASNVLITMAVPHQRQGLAFAIKQSGMPLGTLLAGAAVPLVGLTVGWRFAFVGAAVLAAMAVALVPRQSEGARTADSRARAEPVRPDPLAPLIGLALAVCLAGASTGAFVGFLVSSGVDAGLSPSAAGWALTGGSALGIAVRLHHGILADRRGRGHLAVIAAMLALGSLAFALLSVGTAWAHLLAMPLAYGAGWSWPGLFNLSVVNDYPDTPAAATGITQTGLFAGAMVGPPIFGAIVEASSYGWAWLATAVGLATAAALTIAARDRLVAAGLTAA